MANGDHSSQIALLTPYSGNNLGDAAIQDSMICNLRLRISGVRFCGVSLDCENFVARHGEGAFPLCATARSFYGMQRDQAADHRNGTHGNAHRRQRFAVPALGRMKPLVKSVPGIRLCVNTCRTLVSTLFREVRHTVGAYRLLRTTDLLIVSGGGQLDDEWGGPWGLPYTLFKWTMVAGIAGVPCVMASVGAGKITSGISRFFLSTALRSVKCRSYRDENSRKIAAMIMRRAAEDAVVPDPAFSLPRSGLPRPAGIRSIARGRRIVAVSPIAFAKPGSWPYENGELHDRYLRQMARVISQILERGDFVVPVWSALSDKAVVPDILDRLDSDDKSRLDEQMHIPEIASWRDLVAVLLDADFVIASRLHSAILAFVALRPTIAISFDPKVDWVMADVGQVDFLLQIRDFVAENVIEALDRLTLQKDAAVKRIVSYQDPISVITAAQYDLLAKIAETNSHRRPV